MMEKFHYTLADGFELVVPRFENIPIGALRAARKLQPLDQVFTLLEGVLTEEQLEHLDVLDRNGFNDFMRAWKGGSEIDLGESSASSIS
ncbi:hypothetical protein GTU73_08805 [Rathayibacter sp. VKM Ac-2804]|uniref:hypothetical protein n=1 Tax=Rathayibacter sp. VKM Ac-2804 TaxID=2609257 RepID=UPI00132F0D5A|nr:hypothetical protein [Rathayibacter sp. VKM Ac-2804]QHF24100.1 hypothetical protein GTU73_08805 [Rathayibacter sp. VKM Ac-2804]